MEDNNTQTATSPDNIEQLHKSLTEKIGFNVPLDQFRKDMQDETKLKQLHQSLVDKVGFTVPFDQFKTDMVGDKKKEDSALPPSSQDASKDQPDQQPMEAELNAKGEWNESTPKQEHINFTDHPIDAVGQWMKDAWGSGKQASEEAVNSVKKGIYEVGKLMGTPIQIGEQTPEKKAELDKYNKERDAHLKNYLGDLNAQKSAIEKYTPMYKSAGYVGGSAPYVAMAAASLATGSGEVALGSKLAFAALGVGEGANAYDKHIKETNEPENKGTKALTELLYGALYTVPISEELGKYMPKQWIGKLLGREVLNPEVQNTAGKIAFETFVKDQPTLAKRYLSTAWKGIPGSVAGMETMMLGTKAVDRNVIGDTSGEGYGETAIHAALTGVAFHLAITPFAVTRQHFDTQKRWEKQGEVGITLDQKGRSVEVLPSKENGKQIGIRVTDGQAVEVSPEMAQNTMKVPTHVLKSSIAEFKKTGEMPDVNTEPKVEDKPIVPPRDNEQILADKKVSDEAVDKDILDAQKRLNLSETPSVNISDNTDVTLDKIDKGEPVTNEFLGKASDELYQNYKMLEAMKKSDKRTHSIEQIESMQQYLGEEITNLEDHVRKQKETGEFVNKDETRNATERGAEENIGETPEAEKQLINQQIKDSQKPEAGNEVSRENNPQGSEGSEQGKEATTASKEEVKPDEVSKKENIQEKTDENIPKENDKTVRDKSVEENVSSEKEKKLQENETKTEKSLPKSKKTDKKEPWKLTRDEYVSENMPEVSNSALEKGKYFNPKTSKYESRANVEAYLSGEYSKLKEQAYIDGKTKEKPSWAKTQKEYVDQMGDGSQEEHKLYVEQAIKDGKPVPKEVLNDYPQLKIKENEKEAKGKDAEENDRKEKLLAEKEKQGETPAQPKKLSKEEAEKIDFDIDDDMKKEVEEVKKKCIPNPKGAIKL